MAWSVQLIGVKYCAKRDKVGIAFLQETHLPELGHAKLEIMGFWPSLLSLVKIWAQEVFLNICISKA